MSICNRVTLAQFGRLATTEEDALSVEQIALLLEDAAVKEARINTIRIKLDTALARRYGSAARHLHDMAGETADTVTLLDGDFIVTTKLRQEVDWDQTKLAKLAETIFHDWQRNPEDYIKISYTVEEQTYLAWPPEIRQYFDDARGSGVDKPRVEIATVKRAKPKTGAV